MNKGSERDELRQFFFAAWHKHQAQLPVEPLEHQLINIMLVHPEYHSVLSHPDDFRMEDFPEANPFLHMSLHMALLEQVQTDRPVSIRSIYHQLCTSLSDSHLAEHKMMDCLGQILWDAQQSGVAPDENIYLERLELLLSG